MVGGELDVSTTDRLSEVVKEQLHTGSGHIVVDLADLTFCDSMGLGLLVMLSRSARAQQRYLLLRNPSPFLAQVLDVAGVRDDLNIVSD